MTMPSKPPGYYTDKLFTCDDMDKAIQKEREEFWNRIESKGDWTEYEKQMIEKAVLKERERIKEQNAPEIEKTNAYIKQLELEKMESDILHNEHLKLLGEIKAMTEAARLAEREECAELIPPQYFELRDRIRARGQE